MSEPIYDARTLWELLERRVADSPDRAFLIDDADRTVTFSEAKDQAERMAAGFAALGVGEGTPVTWVLPTRIDTQGSPGPRTTWACLMSTSDPC